MSEDGDNNQDGVQEASVNEREETEGRETEEGIETIESSDQQAETNVTSSNTDGPEVEEPHSENLPEEGEIANVEGAVSQEEGVIEEIPRDDDPPVEPAAAEEEEDAIPQEKDAETNAEVEGTADAATESEPVPDEKEENVLEPPSIPTEGSGDAAAQEGEDTSLPAAAEPALEEIEAPAASEPTPPAPVPPAPAPPAPEPPVPAPPPPVAASVGYRSIDVEINQGPGLPYKMVQVSIDHSQAAPKAFLGGFRNKKSNILFHHASTQTPKEPKYLGVARKHEHETQTVQQVKTSVQMPRESSTQMERGLKQKVLIDTSKDKVMIPRPYQTSEERLAIVIAATCVIQRYWRGYMGRSKAAALKKSKTERDAFQQEQEAKAKQDADSHRKREIERRMHPRTAADFEILYRELEAWRLQETRKIKQAGLPKEKEQEVLQQLLHKETKLLQTIDRLKNNANQENKGARIQRTLAEMGKPNTFQLKDGKTVDVHTPFTTRAMELMQLYNGLSLTQLTVEERLDVLLHVKWTVKEFDCNLTREIVDLIEREADLTNRGRNQRLLEGLRKRISSLFLTFIETPEFNPSSARYTLATEPFETFMFDNMA